MANVGYSIFGRPEGQVNIVNGLFKEAKLGGAMYLDGLTDGVSLNNSESIAVIRQVTDNAGKSNGITIVSVFDYAESFGSTNRPGGFVGSGVCFKGFPHPSMIQKGLFSLQSAANKLVDSQSRKFLHADNSTWGINLPAPNDAWSISVAGINQTSEKNKSRLVVALDVPIRDQMLSVVQGVLSNSIYNSYETVLIAQKGDFIDRAKGKGFKVVSLFDLLDYQALHNGLNKKFNDTKSQATEQINTYSKKLDEVKITLQGLEQKIKQADERHDSLMGRLKQSEAAYKTSKTTAETEGKNLAQIQRDLSEANNNVKKGFDQFLNGSRGFKDEYQKRVRASISKAQQETENKYAGQIHIKNKGWKPLFTNSKFILVFSILLLLIGFFISYFFFNFSQDKSISDSTNGTGNTEKNIAKSEVNDNLGFVIDNRAYLGLLSSVSSNNVDSILIKLGTEISIALESESDLEKLEDSVKLTIQNYFDKTYFLMPIKGETVDSIVDFGTDKRIEILKAYVKLSGNIYTNLGITITDDIGDDTPILKHFIWMVKKLSNHEGKHKDLMYSDSVKHVVPIIKSE